MDTNAPCQRSEDKLSIDCGKDKIEITLPKPVDVIDVQIENPALSDEKLTDIMENNCVYSYGLNEIVEDSEKILIILPDATRKSGAERILPYVLDTIKKHNKEFHFIIAVGTHRQPVEDELKSIMTPDIYEAHRDKLLVHDCDNYDEQDFYGITKRKTTILINKAYRAHDTIITIGSVSYHYFAGYGGGRKLIMPGLASKKTIMANHKLALNAVERKRDEKAVTGNLRNNPVHDDIVDAIMVSRSLHTFFSINTLLNNSGDIIDMTCGDIFMSHMKAAENLDAIASVKVDKKYDAMFLSAGGFPKDINMVQAQKSLDRVAPMLNDGAKVVFFAECADGYGNDFFEEFFDRASSDVMLNELLNDYQINRQTAFNLRSNLEKFDVYLYTKMSDEDCKRMGFKKLTDIADAAKIAENAENTAFVPHAYSILPVV